MPKNHENVCIKIGENYWLGIWLDQDSELSYIDMKMIGSGLKRTAGMKYAWIKIEANYQYETEELSFFAVLFHLHANSLEELCIGLPRLIVETKQLEKLKAWWNMVLCYSQVNQVHHVETYRLELEPLNSTPWWYSPGSPDVLTMILTSQCIGRIFGSVLVGHMVRSRIHWLNRWTPVTASFATVVIVQQVALHSRFEICFEGHVNQP